jgi:SAM-dependent methyltransferase
MARNPTTKQRLFDGIETPEALRAGDDVTLKPCVLCGAKDAERLYPQLHFPVVRCRTEGCGLLYADEHFTEADLAEFYTGDYYQRAYVCHPPQIDAQIAEDYVREFRHVDRQARGGRLLDFGCARGSFIESLNKTDLGDRWRAEGIDINADEIRMGREKALPVHRADLFAGDLEDEAYDAVTAFSVVEHMQDPLETLRALGRALKPGGKLLVIVPNGDSLIVTAGLLAWRLLGERARAFSDNVFHEEHLYYFSPKTLPKLFAAAGYRTCSMGLRPSYLESHPPSPAVAVATAGLRTASYALGRQTMLAAVAEKA